jgi:hypothetical protein
VQNQRRPPAGSEALPRGIVEDTSNFEFETLGRNPEAERKEEPPAKSLLAIPVGIKQKAVVDKLVSKVPMISPGCSVTTLCDSPCIIDDDHDCSFRRRISR